MNGVRPVGQRLEAQIEHRAGQHRRPGDVTLDGAGRVAHAAAIEQLVTDDVAAGIEDGLSGNVHDESRIFGRRNRGHDRTEAIGREGADFTKAGA